MKLASSFNKIAALSGPVKIVQGSQGAGKTYSILQRWILLAARSSRSQMCSIVSDTFPNLRTGAIRDFENICRTEGLIVHKTKTPYVFIVGRWTFEFFSVDKESKGLGGRRDRLFINEANRIEWRIARQLISRTHNEVLVDFNPASEFWAHTQYPNAIKEGSFVKLTYKDNEYLPQGEIDSIERHSPWGIVPDDNYWRVYGLGELGFVEGMIFKNYKKFTELPENCNYQESIGVDFGWQDPLTAVKVWVDHDNMRIYWKELFYGSQVVLSELVKVLNNSDAYKNDVLVCDHEPRSILYLRGKGFAAMTSNKKNGIVADLRTIKQYELFIYHESSNLITEMDNYKYQERKGRIIEYPDQNCDEHAIDAGRYGTTFTIRN